ncbi:hypothetical protein L1F30_13245 [Simiduia sp. 21SJ11W-1]|uniref:hypothetical protein n=1 Tax=Simiduia sp. 21SJ11W-1 TaxID=2909669 RepID=UPI00209E2746|nr:hypothetical protein [Simiduia sp. 21SJ11W-1]UTA47122.1 hypothetical protein L1F30_13245 [Simiduia sp. 21SJ11W-1]
MNIFYLGQQVIGNLKLSHKFSVILALLLLPMIYATVEIVGSFRANITAWDTKLTGAKLIYTLHPIRINTA